jgi:3-hydroxyisobutyrate dehydrogenase-like beta-hydroxyacid dehydrogenase
VIFYSGDEPAFRALEPTLRHLGGRSRFLGSDVGAAAVMYNAVWALTFAAALSFIEAAARVTAAGLEVEDFAARASDSAGDLIEGIPDVIRRMTTGDFAGDQATIDIYDEGFVVMQAAFAEHGITSHLVQACAELTGRARCAGLGGEDLSAVSKILHRTPGPPSAPAR